jgi:hypothetical protein
LLDHSKKPIVDRMSCPACYGRCQVSIEIWIGLGCEGYCLTGSPGVCGHRNGNKKAALRSGFFSRMNLAAAV